MVDGTDADSARVITPHRPSSGSRAPTGPEPRTRVRGYGRPSARSRALSPTGYRSDPPARSSSSRSHQRAMQGVPQSSWKTTRSCLSSALGGRGDGNRNSTSCPGLHLVRVQVLHHERGTENPHGEAELFPGTPARAPPPRLAEPDAAPEGAHALEAPIIGIDLGDEQPASRQGRPSAFTRISEGGRQTCMGLGIRAAGGATVKTAGPVRPADVSSHRLPRRTRTKPIRCGRRTLRINKFYHLSVHHMFSSDITSSTIIFKNFLPSLSAHPSEISTRARRHVRTPARLCDFVSRIPDRTAQDAKISHASAFVREPSIVFGQPEGVSRRPWTTPLQTLHSGRCAHACGLRRCRTVSASPSAFPCYIRRPLDLKSRIGR